MVDTTDIPRCSARALSGKQCFRPEHADDRHDFMPEAPPLLLAAGVVPTVSVEAINWALARDCARMSADIGILHRRVAELESKLEALRKHRAIAEGITPPIVVR